MFKLAGFKRKHGWQEIKSFTHSDDFPAKLMKNG
jgi:hypothetical protein